MNLYPTDDLLSDEERLQDMEQHMYDPLPEGLIEPDWLDLPTMEPDWLDLPTLEQGWLDTPSWEGHELEQDSPTLDEAREVDLDL